MKLLDPKYEAMPVDELQQLQLERLQALLVRLKRNVRRYREVIGDLRVESLADLSKLPVTRADDLIGSFPYGMFALPLREVIRLHSSVGPQGKPLITGHTQNDLKYWGRLVARQLIATGVTANDVIQINLGNGSSSSFSGYVLGAQTMEASVIAEDPLHIDYQLAMLQNYRPTVLITTPTNAFQLIRQLDQRRIDPQSLHLRTVLLSRPVSTADREALHAGLFAHAQCNFGVPEILDPGFCLECSAGRFHVQEDQFLAEIKDGELLVTTLAREATPLLRYATSIACQMHRERCACGRTTATLVPGGRLDDQFRVNEMPLYQQQLQEVLAHTRARGQRAHLEVTAERVNIFLEVSEGIFDDIVATLEQIQLEIESEFLARLGVEARVHLVSPKAKAQITPADALSGAPGRDAV
jgi:phenylacetate-CoA ligase